MHGMLKNGVCMRQRVLTVCRKDLQHQSKKDSAMHRALSAWLVYARRIGNDPMQVARNRRPANDGGRWPVLRWKGGAIL